MLLVRERSLIILDVSPDTEMKALRRTGNMAGRREVQVASLPVGIRRKVLGRGGLPSALETVVISRDVHLAMVVLEPRQADGLSSRRRDLELGASAKRRREVGDQNLRILIG